MKDSKSKEIKVGIISLAGIILLVLGITFGKSITFSNPDNIIKFKFPESNGLQSGEPVVVNGVNRGKVLSVYNVDSGIIAEAELNDISDIYSDASAKITILEITGGKKIEIHPGNSGNKINKNDIIQGTSPPDIAGLVAVVGELSNDGARIIKRLDTLTADINNFLDDEDFMNNIKITVENAKVMTDDLRDFTAHNLDNIKSSIQNIEDLSIELKEALLEGDANINTILDDIDITLQNTKSLTSDAQITLKNADELIVNLKDISDTIKNGKGTVSKIIYDEKFANEIDSIMINLDKFISVIKEYGVNVNVRLGTRP
jgi:phospholipid/cholesterol/gamma-HCH transport system substrate-binding protein